MKIPETWYLLPLVLGLVGYTWACFHFFNDPAHTQFATFFFGCAVFTALIARFLLGRWQQNQAQASFTWTSFALFLLGLLPALVTGLGYTSLR